MRNPEIEKVLEDLKTATMEDLLVIHAPALAVAAVVNELLMQALAAHDQPVALAFVLAALHSAHGQHMCGADKDGLVTEQDRLDIFLAIYHVAYEDALKVPHEQLIS